MSIETGQTFGRYKVKRVLGQGGFATVCLAFDPALQRDVALKVMHAELAADPDLAVRFQGEARQLARMRHPNIVAVHDVGEEHSRPYFTMDYLEGETLHDLLGPTRTLPLAESAQIATQLAGALDYLHSLGVVHRDLKPSNMLIGPGGRLTLLDFGIAHALDQTHLTRTGAVLGTPQYMAPEQVKGQRVGPPADVYAMAVLLYRCLSGRVPFDGDTLSVLHQQAAEPPPPLRELRPGLPVPVYRVLDAALAKDPAQRPSSAGAFAAALAGAPAAAPLEPRSAGQQAADFAQAATLAATIPPGPRTPVPNGPPPRRPPAAPIAAPRPAGRSPVLPFIFAGVAALAVVLVVAFVALRGSGRPSPRPGPVVAFSPAASPTLTANAANVATATAAASVATAAPAPTQPPTPTATPSIVPAGVYRLVQNTGTQQCLRGRDSPSLAGNILVCAAEGFVVRITAGPVSADGFDWYQADGLGWMAARNDSTGEVDFGDLSTPPPPATQFSCLSLSFNTTKAGDDGPPRSISGPVRWAGAQFAADGGGFSGWAYGRQIYLKYAVSANGTVAPGTIVATVDNGGSVSGRFAVTGLSGSGAIGDVAGQSYCPGG